jgi:hypothetical protein
MWHFADLRFADPTFVVIGHVDLLVGDLRINHNFFWICDSRSGTPEEFADLRSRNAPKNLRICDLRTSEKSTDKEISANVSFNLPAALGCNISFLCEFTLGTTIPVPEISVHSNFKVHPPSPFPPCDVFV